MNVKWILSLDGGGIRGVIPARVLMEIERLTGKPISETFDYIAGTSTGGILALCLAKPGPRFTAEQILDMYRSQGNRIFHRSFWHAVRSLGSLIGPKYPATGVEATLMEYLNDATMGASRTNVLVPTYSIEHRGPRFFKSWETTDSVVPMWKIARATSAAPTFFPPYKMDGATLVDGGVFANSPAMCVLADATRLEPPGTVFRVLSIGTGVGADVVNPKGSSSWGGIQWMAPLLEILLGGSMHTTDYQLKYLLGPTNHEYLRLQVTLGEDAMSMDDTSSIDILVAAAETMLEDRREDIRSFLGGLLPDGHS